MRSRDDGRVVSTSGHPTDRVPTSNVSQTRPFASLRLLRSFYTVATRNSTSLQILQ